MQNISSFDVECFFQIEAIDFFECDLFDLTIRFLKYSLIEAILESVSLFIFPSSLFATFFPGEILFFFFLYRCVENFVEGDSGRGIKFWEVLLCYPPCVDLIQLLEIWIDKLIELINKSNDQVRGINPVYSPALQSH